MAVPLAIVACPVAVQRASERLGPVQASIVGTRLAGVGAWRCCCSWLALPRLRAQLLLPLYVARTAFPLEESPLMDHVPSSERGLRGPLEVAGGSREIMLARLGGGAGRLNGGPLQQLRQALETEVETLTSSYMQLRVALNRYSNSKETIRRFAEQEPGHEMLVPLTNSLYVPGTIDNVESLLVDVGTGYFIDKSTSQAQDFLARKVNLVSNKLQDLEKAMSAKRRDVEQVMQVMQQKSKVLQSQARQQAQIQS